MQDRRGDHTRGDEDDEIPFDVLISVGTKQASNQWNIANDRRFIFRLLHVLPH